MKRVTLAAPAVITSGCSYTIKPFNNRVCQLRIDFETFVLEQPTTASGYPQCVTDIFTVGNLRMCGDNSGQHSKNYLIFQSNNELIFGFLISLRSI